MPTLTAAEKEFLLKEFESANELTFHIDEMRNKLTSFYLIFTGAAGGGLLLLLKNELKDALQLQTGYFLSGLFLLLVSIIGIFVICGMGRLRKVQIEYFGIIHRLRRVFYGENENTGFWAVIGLKHNDLPKPRKSSGTYMWLMMVVLRGAAIFGVSVCLLSIYIFNGLSNNKQFGVGLAGFALYSVTQHFLYMIVAGKEYHPTLRFRKPAPAKPAEEAAENAKDPVVG